MLCEGGVLEQFSKLLRREACIANNSAHRDRINRIVARNGHDSPAICHYNVPALSRNVEPSFFAGLDRAQVWDTRDLGHSLRRYFHFPQVLDTRKLLCNVEILADRVLNVSQGLLFGGALGPATREARARHAVAFLCFD